MSLAWLLRRLMPSPGKGRANLAQGRVPVGRLPEYRVVVGKAPVDRLVAGKHVVVKVLVDKLVVDKRADEVVQVVEVVADLALAARVLRPLSELV